MALVVTIVILLILAGITITYVMGDNSIFKKAADAKLNTELAKIEERASSIYADKLLEKVQTNFNNKPTMQQIVGALREEGYTVEQVEVSGNQVTGILLDKETMSLGKTKSNTIQVTLEGNTDLYTYYAKVDGKYYKMHFNGGVVAIDRKESDISSSGDTTTKTIAVSSSDESLATATVDTNTNVVTVTAKSTVGTVKITVTYGEYAKECNIRVCEVATELELNSVRARIATGYTRWLHATAKSTDTASQEFEWTSSNLEVATVDNKGVITAKKKGTTAITVKTTDGSNLSKTCEVTIDDAVDVAILTDFQIKNTIAKDENGNLITVPGDFKVLTSEGTKVTDGIVIQDREGNEFVWVPVDSVSTGTSKPADDIRLGRYTFDTTNGTPKLEQDADNYVEIVTMNGYLGNYYQELTSGLGNIIAKNLGDFVSKTKENGGYYLGKYEASYKDSTHCYSKKSISIRTSRNTALASGMLWNFITQSDAATVTRNSFTTSYVESDLINSYSWDTAIIFIQKYSGKTNYANQEGNLINSSLANTGINGDKVCNIHDMASNCCEWSTEHSTIVLEDKSVPCVLRGSMYDPKSGSTSFRNYGATTNNSAYNSFRPILYVK